MYVPESLVEAFRIVNWCFFVKDDLVFTLSDDLIFFLSLNHSTLQSLEVSHSKVTSDFSSTVRLVSCLVNILQVVKLGGS